MNLPRAILNEGRWPSPSRKFERPRLSMREVLARTARRVPHRLFGGKTSSLRALTEEETAMNSPCL